ncbi:hypothetical protein Pmar_PMAR017016, partial [Perkinsus marinus ATCC 50983]
NFGGTLVVFDRLFGTYLEEPAQTACVYGWTIPANSWVDSVLQLEVFKRQSRSWWKGPGYYTTTAARVCPPAPRLPRLTRSTNASVGVKSYIAVQFAVATLCGLSLQLADHNVVLAAYSLFSYIAQGFLLDGRKDYELVRCVLFILVGIFNGGVYGALCSTWSVISLACLHVVMQSPTQVGPNRYVD